MYDSYILVHSCFQVTSLADFFKDDNVFIAYGQERYALDDFDLDGNGKYQYC